MISKSGSASCVAPPTSFEVSATSPKAACGVDWTKAAHAALSSALFAGIVSGAFYVIGKIIEEDRREEDSSQTHPIVDLPSPEGAAAEDLDQADGDGSTTDRDEEATETDAAEDNQPVSVVDGSAARAAMLLGIVVSASEDEIRAALRARLSSSRVHPDQGGDEAQAKQLIAAKNLLIERARARRT